MSDQSGNLSGTVLPGKSKYKEVPAQLSYFAFDINIAEDDRRACGLIFSGILLSIRLGYNVYKRNRNIHQIFCANQNHAHNSCMWNIKSDVLKSFQ